MNKKLALCLLLALKCSVQAQTYPWKSVALSGAGAMVTGLYTLPGGADNVWIRTDVGGTYRFDSTTGSWSPLNDSFKSDQADYYACDGFAVNPVATNIIYYAGGLSHGRPGALLKTKDGGANWDQLVTPDALVQPSKSATSTTPAQASSINGNGLNRWAGERMAICPSNRNIILYGSRRTGLWRSTSAGEVVTGGATSWVQDTRIPVSTSTSDYDADYGVQCIAFDPVMTGRVYCAVSLHGVYSSDDNGATWTYLSGSSVRPQRLKVANNGTATTPGTVYYTTGDYDVSGNPVAMSVQKYENNSWSTFFPGDSADGYYCGLAINPNDPKDVIVQQGAQSHDFPQGKLLRTRNGGVDWTIIAWNDKVNGTYTAKAVPTILTTDATWYGKPSVYRFSPADLAFDPTSNSRMWGGVWYCGNINAVDAQSKPKTAWNQREYNHEEDVMLCLACPPVGAGTKDYELLEGARDDSGLAWTAGTLGTFPSAILASSPRMGDIKRIAYCESSLSHMMRTDEVTVARSDDGGDTWSKDTLFPAGVKPADLAVCGTIWQAAVVICQDRALVSSTSAAWSAVQWKNYSGGTVPAPMSASNLVDNGCQVLAADHVNGSSFYYLDMLSNGAAAKVWVSSDRGASFAVPNGASTNLPNSMVLYSIKSQPGTQGSVWVSADKYPWSRDKTKEGLYRSTDFGKTFTKLANVDRAVSFGFGKEASSTSPPTLYIYGRMKDSLVDAPYFSTDLGATWTSMANPANNLSDGPTIMEGSRKTFGRVFVGTGGRGIFFSK